MRRATLKIAESKAAPMRVILYTLPLWAGSALLTFVMPLTGTVTFIVIILCLLVLPFKARTGICPECGTSKMFPFSGFGSACKGCGNELVLRGEEIHLLEKKSGKAKVGTGRADRD